MASQTTKPDGQRLCKACGLCCKGVWFSHATLDETEATQARAIGLKVVQKNDKTSFMQPSPKHVDGCCSAYGGWRLNTCVNFSCALLDQLQAGEVSEEKALSHVAAAREMAECILAETGPMEGGLVGDAFLCKVSAPWDPDAPSMSQLSAESRMEAGALRFLFERQFKNVAPDDETKPVAKSTPPEIDRLA